MRGYKATYNYMCRDQHYEIGKTYELEGEPNLCVNGFHFCPKMSDVLKYYAYKPNEFKLLEIEAVGEIVEEEDKACTNKIKILREVPKEEWDFYKDLDDGNYEIVRYSSGPIISYIYDKNGNEIYRKGPRDYEQWTEYDEKGNVIHYKDSRGLEEWREYDGNGKLTSSKRLNGKEWMHEYYDEGVYKIHSIDTSGCETWAEYDERMNLIMLKRII